MMNREIAVEQLRASDPEHGASVLVFELAGQQYALPVRSVHEVAPLAALIQLPAAPIVLAGILRLRGALLAVIDLRARLGLPQIAPEISHRIVITAVGMSSIGLLVDAVHGLRVISRPGKAVERTSPSQLICGVFETETGVVMLLDLDAIISPDLATFLATTLDWPEGTPTGDIPTLHMSRGLQ